MTEIEAKRTAEIVKKANSEFIDGIVPKDRAKRLEELRLIEGKAEKNWNDYNTEFYKYDDNLTELLVAFVLKNKSDFEK